MGANRVCIMLAMTIGIYNPNIASVRGCNGLRVEGDVFAPAGALIRDAVIIAGGEIRARTDVQGHFSIACLPSSIQKVSVAALGFSLREMKTGSRREWTVHLDFHLAVARVEANVAVSGSDRIGLAE